MNIAIIGSGLSGITLAHFLDDRSVDFTLFHSGENVSSTVAAGSINPLVFRRMTKSWRVDDFLPFTQDFFRKCEEKTQSKFYIDMPIRRLFSTEQEANEWKKKQYLPDFEKYMYPLTDVDSNYDKAKNTFGTALVKQSAYVDAKSFMQANLSYFESKGKVRNEKVDYSQLNHENGTYKNEAFDFFVFCEGKDNLYNPWFSVLPVTQTKGEVLTVSFEKITFEESLNRKCFLLPLKQGNYKIGSTYIWDTDNTEITEVGRNEILSNLTSITDEIPTVLHQEAGVRPTTVDRRPICGQHPKFDKFYIFNGLGAKGYLIAPKLIQEFTEYLFDGKEMDKEVSINRYNYLFD
jgi:glycine/D-amino acid oxidase-like deaminating enzyme